MISAFRRKLSRFVDDPVLRRWTIGAVLGRYRRPAPFDPHRPPYLAGIVPSGMSAGLSSPFNVLSAAKPVAPLTLHLPGASVTLEADDPLALFRYSFADTETLLAVHRFAWLPLQGETVSSAWVDILWRGWIERFAEPDDSWAWHPYTAAERAINVIDFAARHGMPGPSGEMPRLFETHARTILQRLEYYGEHDSGNHLANNGRGLYRIGLAFGIDWAIDAGARILMAEAVRIFRPSGILREGSTHYHALLTRNYVDAWIAAIRKGRPEAADLERIASRAIAVLRHITLDGQLPLIGDISPDCPPAFLAGLHPDADIASGWSGLLDDEAQGALRKLKRSPALVSADEVAADGWIRMAGKGWDALAYVSPEGWVPMPGHGHQDMCSFEAHWHGIPLIVDAGRGAYGEAGDAAFFTTAYAHNGLIVAGTEPYPPNKPYYDSVFRQTVCGAPPVIRRTDDTLAITHHGFSRLRDVGAVTRTLSFDESALIIVDSVEGKGRRSICQQFVTPYTATMRDGAALIDTPSGHFRLIAESGVSCRTFRRWTVYGVSEPASIIEIEGLKDLPYRAQIRIEKI